MSSKITTTDAFYVPPASFLFSSSSSNTVFIADICLEVGAVLLGGVGVGVATYRHEAEPPVLSLSGLAEQCRDFHRRASRRLNNRLQQPAVKSIDIIAVKAQHCSEVQETSEGR